MTPQKFLSELKAFDREKYAVVEQLRGIILKECKPNEEIKYNGLYYSKAKPFAGLFVSKNHVSMEFSNGAVFKDVDNILKGTGKHRRHLTFTSTEDIEEANIKKFLKQAVAFAT